MGSRYPFDFLSGNIDVSHIVFPMRALTESDPHPRFKSPNWRFISSDISSGIVTKCHPAIPGYNQTTVSILYSLYFTDEMIITKGSNIYLWVKKIFCEIGVFGGETADAWK